MNMLYLNIIIVWWIKSLNWMKMHNNNNNNNITCDMLDIVISDEVILF